MTIQRAREILGKRSEKYSNEEISKLICLLTGMCNRIIDKVVGE